MGGTRYSVHHSAPRYANPEINLSQGVYLAMVDGRG